MFSDRSITQKTKRYQTCQKSYICDKVLSMNLQAGLRTSTGLPLIENWNSISFWVHWKLPNCNFMFFDRYWSHIQDSREFIRRVLRIVGTRLFKQNAILDFPKILKFLKHVFEHDLRCVLKCLQYLGVAKVKHDWFWGPWSWPLGPKIMNMRLFGFLESETEKLLIQSEAE